MNPIKTLPNNLFSYFVGSSVLQNTIRLHYYSLLFYNMSGSPVECYRDNTNYSTPIPMPSTIECPSKTRTIEFHTTQPNPEDGGQVLLEICEVEIYGMLSLAEMS